MRNKKIKSRKKNNFPYKASMSFSKTYPSCYTTTEMKKKQQEKIQFTNR